MNIKDIENFINVASYKSFSFAAKMMGVSQPTLSESIRRLEKDIGTTLFYRSKAGIELTPQGHKVLGQSNQLVSIKNDILIPKENEIEIERTIKIGCHPTVGRYFLTDLLKKLKQAYKNVTVDIVHAHSSDIQKLIQQGKVDLAIVVNPISNPDLIIKRVCYDKVYIWESVKYKTQEDQFIADLELIQVQSIIRKWKTIPRHHISSNDFQLIAEMTEGGVGYGILPEKFVKLHKLKLKIHNKSLVYKDELSMIYRPEFNKDNVSKFLIESIKEIFKA